MAAITEDQKTRMLKIVNTLHSNPPSCIRCSNENRNEPVDVIHMIIYGMCAKGHYQRIWLAEDGEHVTYSCKPITKKEFEELIDKL